MNIYERSKHLLSPAHYENADPVRMVLRVDEIHPPADQHILRMLVKSPETDGFVIPEELVWMGHLIQSVHRMQENVFHDHPYVYVTVRSGVVKTSADAEWHVDGFSMRTPHLPEQNYIWSDCYGTEMLDQQFSIPEDFDPFVHNIHKYFQKHADSSKIWSCEPKNLYIIDPYVVHRRPKVPQGTQRTFFRISFVPIEIEDDTCTPNPLLPPKVYGRSDIRKKLIDY